MLRHSLRSGASEGFTLIELLIVIAIIAILAGLLFPVFASARSKAREAACLSNQKQILQALALYTGDYDEHFFSSQSVPPIHGGNEFAETPYEVFLASYLKNYAVYVCPEDSVLRVDDLLWDGSFRDKLLKRSYAISSSLTTLQGGSLDPNAGIVTFAGVALSELQDAANTIGLSENWGAQQGAKAAGNNNVIGSQQGAYIYACETWALPGRNNPPRNLDDQFAPCIQYYADPAFLPARGHQQGGVYGLLDGHVKRMTWSQVRDRDFWLFKRTKPAS
ncbi:MAG TPA: prepilin-type N-terminal cleavage/methylation domain-containing protein [Chthonomonadaceae bacterium]|nr:prepilin-type N-terminal cleavage/methylation domain-containing protein [Chthonomonadaceae bacterium]